MGRAAVAWATIAALLCGASAAAAPPGSRAPDVALTAELAAFVPAGQRAYLVSHGDLNRDGRPDALLVVEPVTTSQDGMEDRDARELLVLVRGEDGRLGVAARNRRVVRCARCGGMMGDPVEGVAAGPGTIVVDHYGGSGWRWAEQVRFAWSRRDRTWQLVEVRSTTFHASDPERMKTRVERPPRDFGKIDFADWDPDRKRDKR